MTSIDDKFAKLEVDHAPGQEERSVTRMAADAAYETPLSGIPVDFSHGNVDPSAFEPTPGALQAFIEGVGRGTAQAYTEYRGQPELRAVLATRLASFTGTDVSARDGLILTPGTQGALFLAVASTVTAGDKVAIVQPDYFANRKLVEFMDAEPIPVPLDYLGSQGRAGLDLDRLEAAFGQGARVFLFSNPNNPTGVVYSSAEIEQIAALANRYGVTVIVDQLYSRLRYPGGTFSHLCASSIDPALVVTIMGPSKTESLSGFRLGVAFGGNQIIERMERLQGIVSLRAPGYSQAVLRTWFDEPPGWLDERIEQHRLIRDDLVDAVRAAAGMKVRVPDAGSYLFPRLPPVSIPLSRLISELRQRAGVIVTPGTEFSPHRGDSIRLNFSQNRQAAVEAMKRIIALIDQYRS
jgi:aspartate/methionine/tyrosine aminotransferase